MPFVRKKICVDTTTRKYDTEGNQAAFTAVEEFSSLQRTLQIEERSLFVLVYSSTENVVDATSGSVAQKTLN